MDYLENFDYRSLVGREVTVVLNDYTEVKGKLLLYGFRDRTIVVEDYTHKMNDEVLRKGHHIIIKESMWSIIAVEEHNE